MQAGVGEDGHVGDGGRREVDVPFDRFVGVRFGEDRGGVGGEDGGCCWHLCGLGVWDGGDGSFEMLEVDM